jgi:hypothetical protein
MKPITQLVVLLFVALSSTTPWAQADPQSAPGAGAGIAFGQAPPPPGSGRGISTFRPPQGDSARPEGTVSVGKPEGVPLKRQRTFSSLDAPDRDSDSETFPAGSINLEQVNLAQILKLYEDLSGRTMIASPNLAPISVTVRTKTALLRREVLQAFDTILAQHGITIIPVGTEFVKAVPASQAGTEAGPVVTLPRDQLPESDSYMTYIVEVKNVLPREIAPAIQPFARMPGASIMAIDSGGLVILRDYSSNIRRMLQLIERLDSPNAPAVPAAPLKPAPKR